MSKNKLSIKGKVIATLRDAITGKIISKQETKNLIVNVGKNYVAAAIRGDSYTVFDYIAVGTSSQTPAPSDTTLITEEDRNVCTGRTRSNNVVTFSTTFSSSEANDTLTETGLFNDASAGTMLARALFVPSITKTTSILLSVDWVLTFG